MCPLYWKANSMETLKKGKKSSVMVSLQMCDNFVTLSERVANCDRVRIQVRIYNAK